MNRFRARGFTLVEVLVAITIFGLAAALAYGGLDGLVRARGQMHAQAERLSSLQLAMMLIERDLRATIDRPVRDGFGGDVDPFRATSAQLELTRGGHANSLAQPRAELERIGYQLDGRTLQRLRWPVLDRAPRSLPDVQPLLEDVERFEVRVFDRHGQQPPQWPLPRSQGGVPRAVEVRLVVTGIGEVRRLLELPEPAP